ncbi:hypothetical protein [Alloactinosynnema sp. L-07]|uniref:hypothetical protein n=1 Tax=Alloactinosynnema sp. L-07 TaxID=1653480 RepID=UPI00065EFF6B|nr:hypothetical protein [Alloactinosynnema sp. L-07]CRK59057.1 hypothetical protein [Alloactinosynnema sp. L-07]
MTHQNEDPPMSDRVTAFITDAGYTLEPWQQDMLTRLYHGRPAAARVDIALESEAGDIVDLIDAAIGCQHCGGTLDGSPSGDFCSPDCQQGWHAARTDPLVGYREPYDLPVHVDNLVERHSPECTPRTTEITIRISPDISEFQQRMREQQQAAAQAIATMQRACQRLARQVNEVECDHRPPTLSGLADAAPEPTQLPPIDLHQGHGPDRRPHRNRGGRP